jgi:CubicO group peptidase (beta-lactamase class C family)
MRFFSDLVPRHILAVLILTLMAACGGGGSGSSPALPDQGGGGAPPPPVTPDFSEVDAAFQSFIDESLVFDGISYVVVDAGGTLHTGTFGDHTEDTVVMLASTSKVPAVMTLMALEEDPASTFSMSQPIGEVLPFNGVYADRTPAQLVSNTSGIPGLRQLGLYGPHLCQFSFAESIEFEACGQILLSVPLPDSHDAGSIFDYGGSQWQLAGVTATVSANATWNQLVDQYLATPCELEVFTFGNMWENLFLWDGTPGSLLGQSNPNIEGGAITNLADYAKLLQVHLNGGYCGETQVLSEAALAEMRVDRGGVVAEDPVPYGMGWWIDTDNPGVFDDPGAFGSVSFLDVERGFGGYVAIDDYTRIDADAPARLVRRDIIPLLQSAFDAVAE